MRTVGASVLKGFGAKGGDETTKRCTCVIQNNAIYHQRKKGLRQIAEAKHRQTDSPKAGCQTKLKNGNGDMDTDEGNIRNTNENTTKTIRNKHGIIGRQTFREREGSTKTKKTKEARGEKE